MIRMTIIITIIYFAAMFAVGLYGRKHAGTAEEYLSMDKSAGVLLLMGGFIGGGIGNGFVVGGAGAGAAVGLAGSAYGLACAGTGLVGGLLLNRYIYRKGYKSYAEMTRDRFQSEIPGSIFDICCTIGGLGIIAGQLLAGKALFETLGLSGLMGVVVISVVILLYSQMAGLWGSYATSLIQILIVTFGLVILFVVLCRNGAITQIQTAQAAGKASPYALNFKGIGVAAFMATAMPIMISTISDQTMFMRITSAKSEATSRNAHVLAAFIMVPLAIIPAFVGSYANAKYGIADDTAFFTVIENEISPVLAALLVAVVIAAVMSTVSGGLIASDSIIIRDVLEGALKKQFSDKQFKSLTLLTNVVIVGLSGVLAMYATSILDLMGSFYELISAACFAPFVGGIFWKKGTAKSAIISSIVGIITVVLGWIGLPIPSWGGMFPCVTSAIAFVIF